MTMNDIKAYLADALDQEACRATLIAALWSRVDQLRSQNVTDKKIITSLQAMGDDPFQLNVDVIDEVIESIVISPQGR